MSLKEELKNTNNSVMTVMENRIMFLCECGRERANYLVNEILNIEMEAAQILEEEKKEKELKNLIGNFHQKLDEAIAARKMVLNYLEENFDIDTDSNVESLEDENIWCYGIDVDTVEMLVEFSRASISK